MEEEEFKLSLVVARCVKMQWIQGLNLCCVLLLSILVTTEAVPVTVDQSLETSTGEALRTVSEDGDFGLHYDQYLQEVFLFLEEDEHFHEKLQGTDMDDVEQGTLARELEFVSQQVRTKLDELKRREISRLRTLIKAKHALENGKGMTVDYQVLLKQFQHLNHLNPHTFEVEDLDQLLKTVGKAYFFFKYKWKFLFSVCVLPQKAASDLENYDKDHHEMFKMYEMMKEHEWREYLKTLDEKERTTQDQHYRERKRRHVANPHINYPGSQEQLKEVWVESDGLDPKDFDPKTFFILHDTNGDGYLDELELEALFTQELTKIYKSSDVVAIEEERLRMREHVMKEADTNNDRFLSLMEFMVASKKRDFVEPDTWETLEQGHIFTDEEMKAFERLIEEAEKIQRRKLEILRHREELKRHQEWLRAQMEDEDMDEAETEDESDSATGLEDDSTAMPENDSAMPPDSHD
ncbi:nucleobindin-2-like [Arapaima gigas]